MKIGIALSGGGVRGAAHIGVIKALEENNIKIDCIAGTSAGAIVSALYAMGYNTNEMLKLFEYFAKDIMEINPKFIFNSIRKQKSIKISGLASSYGIEKTMNETAKIKKMRKIKDIGMPIAIPATDLLNCKKVVFTNRELIGDYYVQDIEIGKAVRASSNFPGMYEPFEYREYQFVDGGIYDNLPIGELKNMGADKTIGVKFDIDNKKKQSTIYNISMKSIDLMQEVAMQESIKQADGLININLREVKAFNVDKVDFCYEQGYKQTIKNISKIKQVLNMEN